MHRMQGRKMTAPKDSDRDLVAIAKTIEDLVNFENAPSGWHVMRALENIPLALIRIDERLKALENRNE